MKKLLLLPIFALALAGSQAHAQDECDATAASHYEQRICQEKRLGRLDDRLNQVYQAALATMPEKDDLDKRKGREQLRKSQRAWLVYYGEQCALEGGLEGGANSWVTTFAGDCMEEALNARIQFLQDIVDGKIKG